MATIYVLAGNESEFRRFLIHSGLQSDSVKRIWSTDDLQGTELGSKCYIYGTFWLTPNSRELYNDARSREFDFINV